MTALDVDAMATAIAARYAPGVLTPPAGLVDIRQATADLPGSITKVPVVLVFVEEGAFRVGGGTRLGSHRWIARFYFGVTRNLERELNACRKWLKPLLDAHLVAIQLGGLVEVVRTDSYRIGQMDYAGRTYTGIELGIGLTTSEAWTPTA